MLQQESAVPIINFSLSRSGFCSFCFPASTRSACKGSHSCYNFFAAYEQWTSSSSQTNRSNSRLKTQRRSRALAFHRGNFSGALQSAIRRACPIAAGAPARPADFRSTFFTFRLQCPIKLRIASETFGIGRCLVRHLSIASSPLVESSVRSAFVGQYLARAFRFVHFQPIR